MARKILASTLVLSLAALLTTTAGFAGKPVPNQPPVVTAFDVPDNASSPVPVLLFTASDAEGPIAGYLITETAEAPTAGTPGWSSTPPSEYVTSSTGFITLFAWAMDGAGAISSSRNDTTTVADPLLQRLTALEAQVAALQSLLQHFSRNGNEITISGANLNINSGSGATAGPANGLGNLVVGYNERRGYPFNDYRTGSHNLVVGERHNFSGYGNVLAGTWHDVTGNLSAIVGGQENQIGANGAAIAGGQYNAIAGNHSAIVGGTWNRVNGALSVVAGGGNNHADSLLSLIVGGHINTIFPESEYGVIVGGSENKVGSGNVAEAGDYAAVFGGWMNSALYVHATTLGGYRNAAANRYSTVSGGGFNSATGIGSAVAGGEYNTASGDSSAVSGGASRSATGWKDWVAGGLWQDQ